MKKLRFFLTLMTLMLVTSLAASCALVPPGFDESTRERPLANPSTPSYTPRASLTDATYAAFDKTVTLSGEAKSSYSITVTADVSGMYTAVLTHAAGEGGAIFWMYNPTVGDEVVSQNYADHPDRFNAADNTLSVYLRKGQNTVVLSSTRAFPIEKIEFRLAYAGKMVATVGFGGIGNVVSATDTVDGTAYTKDTALAAGKDFVTTTGGHSDYRMGSGCTVFIRNGSAYLAKKLVVTEAGFYRLGLFAHNFYNADASGDVILYSARGTKLVEQRFGVDNKQAAIEAGLYSGVSGMSGAFWMDGDFVYLTAGEYTVEYKGHGSFIMGAVTLLTADNDARLSSEKK